MGYDCYTVASAYANKSLLIMMPISAGQEVAVGDEKKGMSLPVVTGFTSSMNAMSNSIQKSCFQKAVSNRTGCILPHTVQKLGSGRQWLFLVKVTFL